LPERSIAIQKKQRLAFSAKIAAHGRSKAKSIEIVLMWFDSLLACVPSVRYLSRATGRRSEGGVDVPKRQRIFPRLLISDLKVLGLQLAAMLPQNKEKARLVIEMMHQILEKYL
jgi:hypothetical protein